MGAATRALASLPIASISLPALLPQEWAGARAFLNALHATPEHYGQWEMRREL